MVSIQLVITDTRVPRMDGFELIHRLRRLRESLPIIVTTGYASTRTEVRALRAGVQDHIMKPFNLDVKRLQKELLRPGFYLGDEKRLRELGLA